ncbi:hypothetical protein ERO13_D10G134600v2 [Gossypium hirsutum]|nr:hypothetical protein ERO13_D10G134600v2 [Gossypium hirsutum]
MVSLEVIFLLQKNLPLASAQKSVLQRPNMAYKISSVLFRLVLLLSFSLLLPPSSPTNTHLIVQKINEVIRRDLIGAKPPPNDHHPGGGQNGR